MWMALTRIAVGVFFIMFAQYKLIHRRRFITYDEMLGVIESLGYHK